MSAADDRKGDIYLTREGRVATIHLNRPSKRNALSTAMWKRLEELVDEAERDAAVRVLVVTGDGGTFAAGSDIEEFGRAGEPSAASAAAQVIHGAERKLHRSTKPTLAKVSGACIGAGCGVVLCCDARIADTTARFGITPARLGLVYSVADTKRLVDTVGAARARDMLFTGRILDAPEALSIGLIGQLTAPEMLGEAVGAYAAMLAEAAPSSVRIMKRHLQMALDGAADDTPETYAAFAAAITGLDFKEGHAAFLAKRPPKFGGTED